MAILKNLRHEKFALALFTGMSQQDAAIEAGYTVSRARFTASRLVTYGNIQDRIKELHELAKTPAIMSVTERKERLSEIGSARLCDFIEVEEDGQIKRIDIRGAHSAALQEVAVTEFTGGKDQRARERSTKIKLHDPVRSIAELNKMEGEYPATKVDLDWGLPFKELLKRLFGYRPELPEGQAREEAEAEGKE